MADLGIEPKKSGFGVRVGDIIPYLTDEETESQEGAIIHPKHKALYSGKTRTSAKPT